MNHFARLINDGFKKLHKDMIDGLIDSSSCSVQCTLEYTSTKFDDCTNCIFDPIGGKSSNRFQSGGPVPFYHGICPVCNGQGKIHINIPNETIYAMPIWDSAKWKDLGLKQIKMADIDVITMSKITDYSKIKRASSIIIDTTITNLGMPKFKRDGDPEICGLGQSTHILTAWKRE